MSGKEKQKQKEQPKQQANQKEQEQQLDMAKYERYLKHGITKEEIMELKKCFDAFDEDASGSINPKELNNAFKSQKFNFNKRIIFQIIAEIDTDHSGQIEFDEFLAFALAKGKKVDLKTEASKIFNIFDIDKTGKVTLDELRRITRELDYDKSEQQLIDMFAKADLDKDGILDVNDFYNILTGKGYY